MSPSYRCILNHKAIRTACVLPSMLHHHRCSGLGSRLPGALLRPAAREAQGLRWPDWSVQEGRQRLCGQGTISAVCKGPLVAQRELRKSHHQRWLSVCMVGLVRFVLVKHKTEQYSCIDCYLLMPTLWRPHTKHAASVAGGEGIYQGSEPVQPHTWQIICGIVVFIVT